MDGKECIAQTLITLRTESTAYTEIPTFTHVKLEDTSTSSLEGVSENLQLVEKHD